MSVKSLWNAKEAEQINFEQIHDLFSLKGFMQPYMDKLKSSYCLHDTQVEVQVYQTQ